MKMIKLWLLALGLILTGTAGLVSHSALAATATELNATGKAALDQLYAQSDKARRYGKDARAVLVFPRIVKAGLVVGGQNGEGVLMVKGKPVAHYRISAASFGLQGGAQTFGYALFLMNDSALSYLRKNGGWAIGSGPSVVVINQGAAANANSTTLKKDVVAFPFNQKGLMAGIDLEGSKITLITR